MKNLTYELTITIYNPKKLVKQTFYACRKKVVVDKLFKFIHKTLIPYYDYFDIELVDLRTNETWGIVVQKNHNWYNLIRGWQHPQTKKSIRN